VGSRRYIETNRWFLFFCTGLCPALPALLGFGCAIQAVFVGALLFGIPLGALGVALATFIQNTFVVRNVSIVFSFVIWGSAAAAPIGSMLGGGYLRLFTPSDSMLVIFYVAVLVSAGELALSMLVGYREESTP